jgi:hypothetical protein
MAQMAQIFSAAEGSAPKDDKAVTKPNFVMKIN